MSESNEPKPHMELTSQLNPQKSEPKLELIIRVHGVDNLVVDEDDCRLVEYLVAKIRKNWDTKT
jgi:uncharacterized protein (UPF0216 family)